MVVLLSVFQTGDALMTKNGNGGTILRFANIFWFFICKGFITKLQYHSTKLLPRDLSKLAITFFAWLAALTKLVKLLLTCKRKSFGVVSRSLRGAIQSRVIKAFDESPTIWHRFPFAARISTVRKFLWPPNCSLSFATRLFLHFSVSFTDCSFYLISTFYGFLLLSFDFPFWFYYTLRQLFLLTFKNVWRFLFSFHLS